MPHSSEPKFVFTDSQAIPWLDSKVASGVQVKNLGKANGRAIQLVRFAPGAVFPFHEHTGPEFIFLLEGEAFQHGQRLTAGWAGVAEQGTVDDQFHSVAGCLFLLCYSV
ncbi:cupin domain-containing protein [Crenobacter sp. SG2303]|uniref:Cupin domain-containing protein n=1 Tax=Crenobacter oryzisoli TaxID=3056844 RepID=A0ABT7XI91_9NEIS|nr:cupin domain-containing protein [Crenobacter sp. SG2303]MDN0073481.1 cupin domain-containing protein [Crenobacter sp. SG2303]